jgi:hypothetical protein
MAFSIQSVDAVSYTDFSNVEQPFIPGINST